MTPEVRALLDAFYTGRTTVADAKRIFARREADDVFALIGAEAVSTTPEAPDIGEFTALVWLGYEISIDSRYLGEIWR